MADASLLERSQLAEYEKQLADVNELLKNSPDDESLLSLKSDLEELVALARGSLVANVSRLEDPNQQDGNGAVEEPAQASTLAGSATDPGEREGSTLGDKNHEYHAPPAQADAASSQPPKKKHKAIKEFVVPPHLVIRETDSEADVNRKKRTIKQLKRQHRASVKEIESEKKKSTWQNFQKKKKLGKDSSIFSTNDGERQKTAFNERTRHK